MSDSPYAVVPIESERGLLTPEVMGEVRSRLLAADTDVEVHGIIVTGLDDVFCGGLDLAAIRAGGDPVEFARSLADLLKVLPRLTKPIVAAVNGDALASGASIVAACDFAVAVTTAKIGSYEVAVGVWPMVAQVPLIHRLGARRAMENIGSGEPFTAARALEVGLINRVAEPENLLDTAREWLDRAARGGPANKGRASFYEFAELSYDAALDAALDRFAAQFDRPAQVERN